MSRLLGAAALRLRALELEVSNLRRIESFLQHLKTLVQLPLLAQAQEQAQEDLPLAPLHPGSDMQHADLEGAQHGEDVAERGVVVELHPETSRVDEEEIARGPDLELLLYLEQRTRGGMQIVESLLHGGVFHRIHLQAAEHRVQCQQQRSSPLSQLTFGWPSRRGVPRLGHVATSRRARLTAL